jgi:transaldolase
MYQSAADMGWVESHAGVWLIMAIRSTSPYAFSANQALLAAKAGATYISPFVGRLDDISADGMGLIGDIRQIYDNYPDLETEILVASVRSPEHIRQSALIGADVATLPPEVLRSSYRSPADR